MMDRGPLRVALIGAGGIGKIHLERYVQILNARVVAVCDPDENAAQAAATRMGAKPFPDAARMLEESSLELEAIDICTPTALHLEPALQAIQHGLHVLCEKPLAQSPDAARQMVEAAQSAGVLLMNAFCHRFHPPVVFVKNLINTGELGTITMFRNRFAGPFPGVENRWFSQKAIAGGGVLLDTSIHSIDLFRFLVGEVTRVQAVMRRTDPAIEEVEDTAVALLSTADDRIGMIESCWSLPAGVNVIELYGTQGAAVIHYWDGQTSRYQTREMKEWKPINESGPDRFLGEIRHFVEACLGQTPLQVTGADGLRAMEIAFQAYEAAGWGVGEE